MKSSVTILGLVLAAADVATAACNADNCARAVTGTYQGLATVTAHLSDCKSFFACTATPVPSTTSTTVLVTSAVGGPEKRFREQQQCPYVGAATNCPGTVPTYASACSGVVRYSSACSCFGATTTTSTLTVSTCTVTTSVTVVPAPPDCNNAGLQWAYYPSYNAGQAGLSADPGADIKTGTPSAVGATNYLSLDSGNVYGNALATDFFYLNQRGYIYAPETGTYTITGANVDDIAYVWVGATAYSGWCKWNAVQKLLDANGAAGAGSYQFTLTSATWAPIRIVYRNIGGAFGMDFTLTSPSGLVLIGPTANSAQAPSYVKQKSCDGTSAPPYPAFGQET